MKTIIKLFPVFVWLILASCSSAPEEVTDISTLRMVWNEDPTTVTTIVWDGMNKTDAIVYYGESDKGRNYKRYSSSETPYRSLSFYDMNTQYVKLKNLKPDKKYYFVVKDSEGVSEQFWFKTAPDKPKAFTFVAGGDTKSYEESLEAGRSSNRVVSKLRPLFVLFSGDFTSGSGIDPDNWKLWIKDWHSLTTTKDNRLIPIVAVQGNHEGGNMANLNIIFDAPFQNNDSSNIYFSWTMGGDLFHLMALNSQIDQGGDQKEWLENDLKEYEANTFKVAAYHKPFFPHTNRKRENVYQYEQWAFLFYKYGLDISFDADSHMHKITYPIKPDTTSAERIMGYVRDDKSGTMFVGEGSWGAHPRENDDDKAWTLASGSFNQIKWLHVYPENKNEKAYIDIYTVITASYDENDKLSLFNDDVEPLTEDNRFTVPAGLELFINKDGKEYIRYPYN